MKDAPRRGGGGPTGGLPHAQHVTFSVLSTSAHDDDNDDGNNQAAPGGRRWRALALVVLGVVALAASTATLAAPSARRGGGAVEPNPSPAAPPPPPAAERLVSEDPPLNGTQACLMDASRLRAYLKSDAWRERKARLFPPSSGGRANTRGVVIPAGGRDHLLNALVTVRHLRRVGCRLPIEVVHFGGAEVGRRREDDEEEDAKSESAAEASSARKAAAALALEPGVRLVDASLLASAEAQKRDLPHHRFAEPTSFGKKVFAAAFCSSFRHALLLDGDSLPLLDPAPLFDAPDFQSAGSMFWPDFWHSAWTDAGLWRALGVVPPWERDEYKEDDGGKNGGGENGGGGRRWRHRLVESGQLLLDRERHADVLEWAWLLNGPNRETVYKAMHGDKDTWRLAFDLAGKSGGGYRAEGAEESGNGGGGNDNDNQGRFFLVPHMARDAMREGPAGHAHRWHHIGVLQAAPRGVPAVLEAAAKAAVAGEGDDTNGNSNATAPLRRRAEEAFGRAAAAAGGAASAGWPFFLHRTSFNAKFFPDCARRPEKEEAEDEEEEGGAAAAAAASGNGTARRRPHRFYCRPTHASVPLADEQAGRALKPHMYAFDAQDVVDVSASASPAAGSPSLLRRCVARLAAEAGVGAGGAAAAAAPSAAPGAPEAAANAVLDAPGSSAAALLLAGAEGLVEQRCAREGLGQRRGALPVQVFSVDEVWPYVSQAVDASIGMYWQVRRAFWEAD
jgi:hypothetical protein